MLHQSLSFSLANAVQDDSDIASSASCAIFEEADMTSSVSKAEEDEHEPKEEMSWAPDHCPTALDDSNLCNILAHSLSISTLPTRAFVVEVPTHPLSSAPPGSSVPSSL